MSIATELLKAPRVGVRAFKEHLSSGFLRKVAIITDRGTPISVNLPYGELVEIADILDELSDPEAIANVLEGRKAIEAGAKGISVSRLFRKIRRKNEK